MLSLLLASIVLSGTCLVRSAVPSPPSGFKLLWSDDFGGSAKTGVDLSKWLYTTGTSYPGGAPQFGTWEIETMTSSTDNVYHDGNGNLVIQLIRDSAGKWTSGRIETLRTDFMPPNGGSLIVEGRMQLPGYTGEAASGIWPAFWMLGSSFRGNYQNWPAAGEIDIMENVNGMNRIFGTLHCDVNPGGECNETNGKGGSIQLDTTSSMHVYRIVWSQDDIKWYLDNTLFHQVSKSEFTAKTWNDITNHGYFILLNLSVGGAFPEALGGKVTEATGNNAKFVIDYVAVWSSENGSERSTALPAVKTTTSTIRTVPSPATDICRGQLTCNGQVYDCASYVCLGNMLCPKTAPNNCNGACYSSDKYSCCNNSLQPLGSCGTGIPNPDIPAKCANKFHQCGGKTYSGVKCCVTGMICKYSNDWYSQCV